MTEADHTLQLPDGRRLGYALYGAPRGRPIFYCHGFPGSRLEAAFSAPAASRLGLCIVAPDRPGYGLSEEAPRREIRDWPTDVAMLADHLGFERFALLGLSGGAPYALACAALLPQRITAAAIVAGLGPTVARGATADMLTLHRLFLKLFHHSPPLGALLYTPFSLLLRRFPEAVFSLLASRAPAADREALGNVHFRRILMNSTREAFRRGGKGPLRDLYLYTRPWNLPLEAITAPTGLWHGEEDVTVPVGMGREMARSLPHAHSFFLPNEGHFSLPLNRIESILSFLAQGGENHRQNSPRKGNALKETEHLPVFVYGTLRRGEKNYPRYLEGRTAWESAGTIRGELRFVENGGYPYVVAGDGAVRGEVMKITPSIYAETLRSLDELEEYDPGNEAASVYLRRRTVVRLDDGKELIAWTYFWNRAQVVGEKIESGDFKNKDEG